MQNHYETLGISKTATEKEIKQAFRALSMKFHPDKVKTKSQEEQNEANQKMQEINSANEVLSDPQQRQIYDMEANGNPFGNQFGGHPFGNPFGHPFGNPFGNSNIHFAQAGPGVNILEMLFGQGGAMHGEMHGEMHGGMHGGMPGMFFQRHIQKPEPIVKDIHITLKQAYTGTSVQVEFERWIQEEELKINENETIHINIPQGIDDNETILIQGSGNIINVGGKSVKGDVHIQIHVSNDTEFKRNKNDLFYKKTITLKEALCGFKFKLEHLNGNQLGLNVNIVLFTGAKQVFKNLGMVREGITGNLVLDFEVKFPETLTPEQKDAISNIL
jgi:DnaJ-class molecular chaperone